MRYRFRFRATANLLIFLPLATPEVVLGASLLAQFLNLRVQLGFWTDRASRTSCSASASWWSRSRPGWPSWTRGWRRPPRTSTPRPGQAFWRVTFPLLLPGIVAAALLAFAMSFDDFIITNFNSGNVDTFPKFIYVAATRGIPPQANVIGSAMFIIALAIVVTAQLLATRRRRAAAR